MTPEGPRDVSSSELLDGKRAVLLAVPGAFNPTCSDIHLPGFLARAEEIKAEGVDLIACVAVNDVFVMAAWGRECGVGDAVMMLADDSGELIRAMGLEVEAGEFGMGIRSKRWAAVVEDGVLRSLGVEPGSEVGVSSAEEILARLGPRYPVPPDDELRVQALHDLKILDTVNEERFQGLISDLSETLDAPIAYLALIDAERQWLKAKVGPLASEVGREDAFCSHVIMGDEPVVVADARQDPRFATSPITTDDPQVRFYAGVPIADSVTGQMIGTVCIADRKTRELTPRELAILEGFASRVADEVNSQPSAFVAYAAQDLDSVQRLVTQGETLAQGRLFDLWSDLRVATGDDRDWKLKDALQRSRSVVMLLSKAFLESDFVRRDAFHLLLKVREAEGVEIVPILLEPCDWAEIDWLAGKSPLSPNGGGVLAAEGPEIDGFFSQVASQVEANLREKGRVLSSDQTADEEEPVAKVEQPAATVEVESIAPQLFLSHASEDGDAVKELAGKLKRTGLDVWLDIDELKPGDNWMETLEKALQESDAFAVYIGRVGVERWINREVRVALDRNVKDPEFRVIPILGPGADPDSLPSFLAQHHWLDLRSEDSDPTRIKKLVGALLDRPAEVVSLLAPGETPFRGLLPFDVEHAHLFFGRDRETEELLEKLRAAPILTVIGESGSGKSSLVRAGLVPALRAGGFGGGRQSWNTLMMRPGKDPFRELGNALQDLVPDADPAQRMGVREACAKQLGKGTDGLCGCVGGLVPAGQRTLLVIDQFEELFTQSDDDTERDRFIDTLLAGSDASGDRPVHTILTLRADFYSACFEHPKLPEIISGNQYPARAIARKQLAEVIEKPAAMAGVQLEPGLVEAILHDLGEESASLALLEHTLLELWKLRSSATLTHESYESIGRVQGALEHHAEAVYGALDPEQKKSAKRVMLHLAVPGKGDAVTRRQVTRDELVPAGEAAEPAERVLQHLVDQRLLTVRQGTADGNGGAEEVEVAHEALLRGWTRFRNWLDEDREFLFWRQRARTAFEAWQEAERDSGALLRGAPLAEAERWMATRADDLSPDGRGFINASIALARRGKRIRAAVMATIAAVAAIAVIFGWIATKAQREAEKSLLLATTAVDEMLTEVGSEALQDVPQLEEVRQELLGRAKALYQQLSEQRPSAAALRLQGALAPARMAEIDRQMGNSEAARGGLESAIAGLDALARDKPDQLEYSLELAKIHNEMGRVLGGASADPEGMSQAADHYDRAVEIQQALVEARPNEVEYAYELARSHLNRGIVRMQMGDLEAAEADYLEAVARVEPFAGQPGEWQDDIRQQLARSHNQLANLFIRQKKRDETTARYKLAAGLFESLTADHPQSREYRVELAMIYDNLALHQRRRAPVEAEEYSRKAVGLFGDLADALPEIRSGWAKAHINQGRILETRQREEAMASYVAASRIFADLLSDYPDRIDDRFNEAVTLLYLGALRADAGQSGELEGIRQRLAEILPLLPSERRQIIEGHRTFQQIQAGA